MPSSSSLNHRETITRYLSEGPATNWIFSGDSITHGAFHTLGYRDYPEHFAERVRWELQRLQDLVITTAVSGWTIDLLSQQLNWAVLDRCPHVVSINLGVNDAAKGVENLESFRELYSKVLTQIQTETGAALLLHTPNAILGGPEWKRDSLPQYVEIIRAIAGETGAVLVDHAEIWEEARKAGTLAYWLSDAIHPNEYGHRVMAYTLFKELGIFDPKSAACRLMIP